jgi:hypothetical protein
VSIHICTAGRATKFFLKSSPTNTMLARCRLCTRRCSSYKHSAKEGSEQRSTDQELIWVAVCRYFLLWCEGLARWHVCVGIV